MISPIHTITRIFANVSPPPYELNPGDTVIILTGIHKGKVGILQSIHEDNPVYPFEPKLTAYVYAPAPLPFFADYYEVGQIDHIERIES